MQPAQRASYRMYRLRKDRLGDESPDLLDACPPKPPWMRWHTYERLAAADDALMAQVVMSVLRRLLAPAGRVS